MMKYSNPHPQKRNIYIYIYVCVCVCVCVCTGRANHTLVSSVLLRIMAFCMSSYEILFILSFLHLHSSYSYLSSVLPFHHIFLHFSSSVLGYIKWPSKGYFMFFLTVLIGQSSLKPFFFPFPLLATLTHCVLFPVFTFCISINFPVCLFSTQKT